MTRLLQTLQLLFALDPGLAILEHRFETNLVEVNFLELQGTLVHLVDLPSLPEKLLGDEGAVDPDDVWVCAGDRKPSAVLEKQRELPASFLRVSDHEVLKTRCSEVDLTPVGVRQKGRDDLMGLVDGDLSHFVFFFLSTCGRLVCLTTLYVVIARNFPPFGRSLVERQLFRNFWL